MNAKVVTHIFSSLSRERQARIMVQCAHALTIDARDTYIAGTEGIADPVRLRGFNEVQHRVTAQLGKIMESDGERYPDDVFIGMLVDAVKQLRARYLRVELERLESEAATGGRRRKAG